VVDHIIVGHNTYYSFADQDLIKRFADEYERLFNHP